MRVWFNKGLSSTADALAVIRDSDRRRRLTLIASHTEIETAVAVFADRFFPEPADPGDDAAYVAWCLDRCRVEGVGLLVAQRRREALSARRAAFAAAGVRLSVMADPAVLALVERKDALYTDLAGLDLPAPVPPHRVVRTLAEFDRAVADLSAVAPSLCVKPCAGIFGAGFRILEREGDDLARLLDGGLPQRMGLDAFRGVLDASTQDRPLLVMVTLPGVERSVDVLAHQGRLVCAVARAKAASGVVQALETDGPSIDMAALLVGRYRLDGLFNLQTKEWEGRPYLLEINSRMSGGIAFSCRAGVALPYWAVMLAAGFARPEQVPRPRPGTKVVPVTAVVDLRAPPRFRTPEAGERTGRGSADRPGRRPRRGRSHTDPPASGRSGPRLRGSRVRT